MFKLVIFKLLGSNCLWQFVDGLILKAVESTETDLDDKIYNQMRPIIKGEIFRRFK